jgi:ATP-dependent helicase/nuclease subunit B
MTRALKQDGAPTIPSRWILRVRQLATGLGLEKTLEARADILRHARTIDDAPRQKRAARPEPRPSGGVRPRILRVTEIETLRRDPYAIYARHVLDLKPLKDIDLEPGPAERGTAIHKAL